MKNQFNISSTIFWLLGLVTFGLGVLNLLLVHPVPGIIYLLLSFIFFPPVNKGLKASVGFSIPVFVRIILFIIIIWFTLGISDLAEIFGI